MKEFRESNKIDQLFRKTMKILASPGIQLVIYKLLRGEQALGIHQTWINLKLVGKFWRHLRARVERLKGNVRFAEQILDQDDHTLLQFLTLLGEKESLKQSLLKYWKDSQFDILITPVLPFLAIQHGQGGQLLRYLGFCSFQNILDQPAGVVPIRKVRTDECKYDSLYSDNIFRLLESNAKISQNLPVCLQVTSAPWKDEYALSMMKRLAELFPYQFN